MPLLAMRRPVDKVEFLVDRVAIPPTEIPKVPDFSNLLKPVLKPGKGYSYVKKLITQGEILHEKHTASTRN
jgi:hypothetical protein